MTAFLKLLGIKVASDQHARDLIEKVMPSLSAASQKEVERYINGESGLSLVAKTELGAAIKGYQSA